MRAYLLLILLIIPLVSAQVTITEIQNMNLGDYLETNFTVSSTDDVIQTALVCDNYYLNYFSTILDQSSYSLPRIPVTSTMVGACNINITTSSFDQLNQNTFLSNTFAITDILKTASSLEETQLLPGDEIVVTMNVSASYGRPTLIKSYFLDNSKITNFTVPNLSPGQYEFSIEIMHEFHSDSSIPAFSMKL